MPISVAGWVSRAPFIRENGTSPATAYRVETVFPRARPVRPAFRRIIG